MKLNKKDKAWSLGILALPVLALLIGLIPGSAILDSLEVPGKTVYGSLITWREWDNLGASASLQMIMIVYMAVMSLVYLRGQSMKILKTIMVVAWISAVIGLFIALTEENLHLLPFLIFPILSAAEGVVSLLRLRQEEERYDF